MSRGNSMQHDEERQARSLALEKAYVHDVYDHFSAAQFSARYRPWPRVAHFLMELEPGSLVADVGCGNGKYLDINSDLMKIGVDRCAPLTSAARARGLEVLRCDNLHMPFRDETFDAVLSVAVVHHFATTDRRVAAIREITRVLRIGGKVLITVWAMEQRHRKFDSQDVLVPWHEPVKSSSEDHASSAAEREVTSTTSDDDILVYHAYSHASDHEKQQQTGSKKRQKYRNGRGRYRSADSAVHGRRTTGTSSQSSSELSSPNETCYSFVRRAFQKLSNSSSPTGNSPYDAFAKRSNNTRQYFYRSCRKPCVSESMEFGKYGGEEQRSQRNEFGHQDSLESEYPDQPTTDDDIPIELRHLEGYETCRKCGSPTAEFSGFGNCENQVCTSCLPADPEPGKKSRSLGDFLNMIPKLLRVKKCEKEPMSDLHKRISTASDPREYVVKTKGGDLNGIVRSKSTVSMMSRLEELMSMSQVSDKDETVANPNCPAGPRSKAKQSMFQSFNSSTVLFEGSDGTIEIADEEAQKMKNTARRYNSPADALQKLRQDVSLDEPFNIESSINKPNDEKSEEKEDDVMSPTLERKMQNSELLVRRRRSSIKQASSLTETKHPESKGDSSPSDGSNKGHKFEKGTESRLTSYYSMPELYKSTLEDLVLEKPVLNSQKERHISFYEQAQNIFDDDSAESPNDLSRRHETVLNYAVRERNNIGLYQRGLVKRSLSVDTGDNSSSRHVPRRFSASAAQGVLASALRTYSLPRSCSRGSSVKSDTSVDSEESIVSVIPRKGNSITSDTSVDSEESVISVIQRSNSEFETLGSQNGLRNNISRFGSRSAQASPVTVLSSQTSSAESSPPQSGKTDGRFPGSSGVIDQLLQQQQQLLYNSSEGGHSDLSLRSRRCLIRPISDPKIDEKLSSSTHSEEFSSNPASRQSSVGTPKSHPGSLELVEESKFETKEYSTETKANLSQTGILSSTGASASDWKSEATNPQEGELSRTPSPVGPFQYITDPLITGIESKDIPVEIGAKEVPTTAIETKTKSIRFNSEVTNLEPKKPLSVSDILKPSNGFFDMVLKNSTIKKDNKMSRDPKSNSSSFDDSTEAACSSVTNTDIPSSSKDGGLVKSDSTSSEDSTKSKKDTDMRKSFFNLRERLENLASSQNTSLDIFKNVSHTFGSLKNIKEKMDSDSSNESFKEIKVSPTPKSLNDSRQSSLDESSQVTLSDESVMSVEGTSSVSDENDYKRTDEEDENADSTSQNITVKKVEETIPPQNVLTEGILQKNFQIKKCDTIAGMSGFEHHKPSKASSFSDTELHVKKGGARCALRKRLRRSCVTIDEVECREFVSSEDTSPSSSLSLEWNDFDKIDTDSSSYVGCCNGITTIPEDEAFGDETAIDICCNDVNVVELETKFNIVDKEMCVFFETPTSSIGKSASSSSNATDFSTTSDRFRGIIQREKSDDRSSKESDSDNLSKLSDVEGRSDSAFSEDFARRCDFVSSSSSASIDALDSVRIKLGCEVECDGASGCSKQTSNWVLVNIDEIPDDEKNNGEKVDSVYDEDKSPTASTSSNWKKDKSMDFAQRKENFFSSAADCRDMYRISFDSKFKDDRKAHTNTETKTTQQNGALENNYQDLVPMGMLMPNLAPGFLELFPPTRRVQDENEAPTDILAAFVETISDITSAFGELYPRKEAKIEDASSDESVSVGISTFERVLTSSVATNSKNRFRKSLEHQKEKSTNDDSIDKKTSSRKASNGNVPETSSDLESSKPDLQNIGPAFVKLPPEDDPKPNSKDTKSSDAMPTTTPNKDPDPTPSDLNPEAPKSERKQPDKLKILNRASQSVCLERVRQSSIEKEDEQSAVQSAPCSPRMKPRQRSVEEVMSSSRNEFSRNSSLSQSTSQESLPGNDTGGMMSYHRYYHVFRQGELDSLIENHVDNLHILSSYYDHANWCIVAEKVQVWTI